MPPELLLAVGSGVLWGIVTLVVKVYHRGRVERLLARCEEAARQAGLASVERFPSTVTGYSGKLLVRLSGFGEQESGGTRVEIAGNSLAPGLTLCPEPQLTLFAGRNPKEIEVGDEAFDREVSVQGPPALALSLLDADTRRAVQTLIRSPFEMRGHRALWVTGRVDDGRLRVDVPQRAPRLRPRSSSEEPLQAGSVYLDGEYRLPEVLRAALALAARLVAPEDLAQRLGSNVPAEPEPRVRLTILRTLLREFPEHPATRAALVAAREDPDADVRVRAAILLGEEGRDTLLGVAAGEGAEDATSARAVTALGAWLTLEKAGELLKGALRTRRMATAKACLGILGQHGAEATSILAKVLLVEKGELGAAAAEALAATGAGAAEGPLLRALSEGTPELRRAAASALGRVGTRAAVLPLREAEDRDGELRGAARQAIAEIHARLAGAAQGQLSLADGESGRLSIAEDESGRLSLSEAPRTSERPPNAGPRRSSS